MAGFRYISSLVDGMNSGRFHSCTFRKIPSQVTSAGWWADLSMAPGNPPPNYYVGNVAESTALDGFRGIFHGDAKSPASKHLTSFGLITPGATMVGHYMLLDYLLFYPFIDCDDTDVQTTINSTPLTRYTDGQGVQVMAVTVVPTTGSGRFIFTYVNQDGVEKTSPTQYCTTTASNIATIATSQQATAGGCYGPFLNLAAGDSGVRSITSVQFLIANGGLISLVLVKPIAEIAIREINTEAEASYVNKRPGILPRIYDNAYLNFIVNPAGSISAQTLKGSANFTWSE